MATRLRSAGKQVSLVQGTLDLLVLQALRGEPLHGYGVLRFLREASAEALQIEEGALYPALHRMEARGWIEADWGQSENNRRAKYYRLTDQGRHQLRQETDTWASYVAVVNRVLEA